MVWLRRVSWSKNQVNFGSELRRGVFFLCIEEVNWAIESGDWHTVSRWTPRFLGYKLSHDTGRCKKCFTQKLGYHHQAEQTDPLKNLQWRQWCFLGLLYIDGTIFSSSRSLVTRTTAYLINYHQEELVDSPVDEDDSILEILAPGGAKTIVCFS